MRGSKYTRELLAPIVAASRSLSEVMRTLGLRPTGGNHRFISARVRVTGLDTSHFKRRVPARIAALTREELASIVRDSRSVAQVLDPLGFPTSGRPHHALTRRLDELGIDRSHFTGAAWARGATRHTDPTVDRIGRRNTRPDAEVFVACSPETNGRRIGKRLRTMGRPYVCTICGLDEWCGQPLVLHLDHINGVNNDNRVENLRFLCPNCHSQTETYGNRRRVSEAR